MSPSLMSHIYADDATEREVVREAIQKTAEEEAWIVKPASSACGRGIFITKNFASMPRECFIPPKRQKLVVGYQAFHSVVSG